MSVQDLGASSVSDDLFLYRIEWDGVCFPNIFGFARTRLTQNATVCFQTTLQPYPPLLCGKIQLVPHGQSVYSN